jgi:ATP-dependent Zn protease
VLVRRDQGSEQDVVESDERIAYHEAGHAVVTCALGCPFELVTIVPDPSIWAAGALRWDGLAQSEVLTNRRSDSTVDRAITMLFAGAVAEARFIGQEFGQVWIDDRCEGDREGIDRIIMAIAEWHHVPVERVAGRVLSQVPDVGRLIAERWVEVEAVAHALVERQTLGRDEVESVIASTGPAAPG